MKVVLYTAFALVAFAFNSILCRLALRGEEADAAGFTAIRLLSGAVALLLISYVSGTVVSQHFAPSKNAAKGTWLSAIYLFGYAICFSLAYLQLTAGTGALILFGSVQLTMVVVSIFRGERPGLLELLGLAVAVGGLVYLVLPGLAAPPMTSSLLMAAAGGAWGLYTLRGRGSTDPLADTTGNFIRTLPFAIVAVIAYLPNLHLSTTGVLLAAASGAIASGVGYALWYAVLKHHTPTLAGVLQLSVPVLTAIIGVLFLAETATQRLIVGAVFILGGIGLTIFGRRK